MNYKMRLFIVLLLCNIYSIVHAQGVSPRIRSIDGNTAMQALSSGEIQIVNRYSSSVFVDCSENNHDWSEYGIAKNSGIIATIKISKEYLYLKLCSTLNGEEKCDIYRLIPKNRYVIEYSTQLQKLILKNTKS